MRNLLHFLARYNNLILFIIFEGIAVYLLATANSYHNSRIVKGVRGITMIAEKKISDTRDYFRLREINTSISAENAELRNRLERLKGSTANLLIPVNDTLTGQRYEYTDARIVNNSVTRQKNFFTVNKGRNQGIEPDMAVIGPDGIAGIIVGSSENFSLGMSILNIDFRLSSRIRSSGYFGSLSWDGRDYRYAILSEIPQHVPVVPGDTVETTGYSAIFPEGVMVGVISSFERSGSDFHRITVRLSTDFKKLSFVSLSRNLARDEQRNLERQIQ